MLRIGAYGFAVVVTLFVLSSCSSVGYYSQSIVGHSRLMMARQPISKVIKGANETLKSQLLLTQDLRRFAVEKLGLPDNKSYTSYVALERDFPVWTVVAAPEFSVHAQSWCYPIIGCAAYRGYFAKQAAEKYAESLHQQTLETAVSGATAYSTLGWFSDPILPSMLRYGVADLAETLFHELAHQQLYIKNNTDFNEAFATVVGEQGAILWLSENRPELLSDYKQSLSARTDFSELVVGVKQELDSLYTSALSELKMRRSKELILLSLKEQYQKLKDEKWQGRDWFGGWLETPINNARLASFSTYRDRVPVFEQLLLRCGKSFKRLYSSLMPAKKTRENAEVPTACVSE